MISTNTLVSQIPPPDRVRAKLGELLAEVEITRKLLRLSERQEKYKRLYSDGPAQPAEVSP